jgi:RHS repeat-associated protein
MNRFHGIGKESSLRSRSRTNRGKSQIRQAERCYNYPMGTGTLVQWFDYAPYGSIIASTNTGTTTDARQYIGQFSDASGLSYLNARYYNGVQGQFTSEDPVFWGQQNLQDPQSFNAYSYSEGNPITGSDPTGLLLSDYQPYQMPSGSSAYGSNYIQGTYQGVGVYSNYPSTGTVNGSNQCVDFADRYAQAAFNVNLSGLGNGSAYGNQANYDAAMKKNNNSGKFTFGQNGGAMFPQANDIISWGGGAGHVGVIAEVDPNPGWHAPLIPSWTVWTVEQNQSSSRALFQQKLTQTYNGGGVTYSLAPKSDAHTVLGWAQYGPYGANVPIYITTPVTSPQPAAPAAHK